MALPEIVRKSYGEDKYVIERSFLQTQHNMSVFESHWNNLYIQREGSHLQVQRQWGLKIENACQNLCAVKLSPLKSFNLYFFALHAQLTRLSQKKLGDATISQYRPV